MRAALLAVFVALATGGGLPARAPATAVVPDRSIPLFNGRDRSGWEADVPARDTNPDAPGRRITVGSTATS